MALKIIYNTNLLNTALDNAGVFNGENQGFGWNSHFKQNQNANLTGFFNPSTGNVNILRDNDGFDATINDQDAAAGVIGQSF
ncbi:hypothetical protein [Lentibacillus sp. Marseille-P4043]|uniref:hypothetical protein n=1 Tax=Lentibacillus sp. Marseille-P4043 TaxID=2040293 RepID=UPI000D0BB461|nr:hypothetical protein [Lentibacillus sp. Marseille-P4043]